MRGVRWISVLLVHALFLIVSSQAQLPLNRERYLIRQVEGSYTCDLRSGECRSLPAQTFLQLEWQGTAYQTTLADGSTALIDPYCRFVNDPSVHLATCPYDPQRENGFWAYLGGGQPFFLQPTIIDVDLDQDGVEGEKGYTYLYGDNAFFLVAYHPDGTLKYVAYRTDAIPYLYVFVVQVEAQGNLIGLVSREASTLPRPELALYPRPAQERLIVQLTLPRATAVTLTLYDLLGRLCWRQTVQAPAGVSFWMVPRGSWPSGLYLLRMQFDGQQIVHSVVWR
ncbi:T9SS type A sorting domain-containing protein [Rhodothermus profundi]|uniref:Por secretion system C-terminal sorting domain-containing protein n=1 Tax=Rhodothermus profundi TaxID=633813 RepID=A0A1M6P383_9BACT|nr:T9SS type A sorting domain-containing protein [Rhodothermus profundi]SHK02378.1 Por secretion system C-terminal sorting domain-containing protein [Rhodothermus profundi]